MNIIVLIKQVPNTTDVKLDQNTGNLIREGLDSIMNPDDRCALEMALQLKDDSAGKVTALSMGPPQAVEVLTEAIGMGADDAVLLSDKAFAGADTWATAYTLGKAIETLQHFDLVICGRQAIDGDTAQIGPQVADHLNIPQATYVFEIESVEAKEGGLTVKRRLEDGFERVFIELPALLTVMGGANTPRYPQMAALLNACAEKAPIVIWNAADIGVDVAEVGLTGSLTHVIKTAVPKFQRQGELIPGTPREAAGQLFRRLGKSDAGGISEVLAAAGRLAAASKAVQEDES
jgi:electron transfer flavoprotein beta subunit